MEIFKPITGYENSYEISNYGNVKSMKRTYKKGRSNIMKPSYSNRDKLVYRRVSLFKNSKQSNKYVHRLVAEAFIPNPKNLKYVNHIDNDGTNNNVSNLEWVTNSENCQHSIMQGRDKPRTDAVKKAQLNISKPLLNEISASLGSNYIQHIVVNSRRYILGRCKRCNIEYRRRLDSRKEILLKGLCKNCIKMKI